MNFRFIALNYCITIVHHLNVAMGPQKVKFLDLASST
jgi:hypothetical protein